MKFAERYQDILKRNKAFLDVHLTNRCNLNCCCQRLSPLCGSETDYTFNEFKNDFDKILKFYNHNSRYSIAVTVDVECDGEKSVLWNNI